MINKNWGNEIPDGDKRYIGRTPDGTPMYEDPFDKLARLREKHSYHVEKKAEVEHTISMMKYRKALRNKDVTLSKQVYDNDPIFQDMSVDFSRSEKMKGSVQIHPELKKMLYSTLP